MEKGLLDRDDTPFYMSFDPLLLSKIFVLFIDALVFTLGRQRSAGIVPTVDIAVIGMDSC